MRKQTIGKQVTFISLLFSTLACLAQNDSLAFMSFFNNRESVQWKLKGTIVQMGNNCTNGEYLTFLKKHQAIRKTCDMQANTWQPQVLGWQLVRTGRSWNLLIDDKPHTFEIRKRRKITTLIITNILIVRNEIKLKKTYELN